jgi:hypothetical protein
MIKQPNKAIFEHIKFKSLYLRQLIFNEIIDKISFFWQNKKSFYNTIPLLLPIRSVFSSQVLIQINVHSI